MKKKKQDWEIFVDYVFLYSGLHCIEKLRLILYLILKIDCLKLLLVNPKTKKC